MTDPERLARQRVELEIHNTTRTRATNLPKANMTDEEWAEWCEIMGIQRMET